MKARIMKSRNESILACGFEGEMLAALVKWAGALETKLIPVSRECGGEYVGHLAQLAGFRGSNVRESFRGQCLIFSGLSEKRLDAALKELRRLHIDIPLKAVVTPSNSTMTLSQLIAELEKEHKAMHG